MVVRRARTLLPRARRALTPPAGLHRTRRRPPRRRGRARAPRVSAARTARSAPRAAHARAARGARAMPTRARTVASMARDRRSRGCRAGRRRRPPRVRPGDARAGGRRRISAGERHGAAARDRRPPRRRHTRRAASDAGVRCVRTYAAAAGACDARRRCARARGIACAGAPLGTPGRGSAPRRSVPALLSPDDLARYPGRRRRAGCGRRRGLSAPAPARIGGALPRARDHRRLELLAALVCHSRPVRGHYGRRASHAASVRRWPARMGGSRAARRPQAGRISHRHGRGSVRAADMVRAARRVDAACAVRGAGAESAAGCGIVEREQQ